MIGQDRLGGGEKRRWRGRDSRARQSGAGLGGDYAYADAFGFQREPLHPELPIRWRLSVFRCSSCFNDAAEVGLRSRSKFMVVVMMRTVKSAVHADADADQTGGQRHADDGDGPGLHRGAYPLFLPLGAARAARSMLQAVPLSRKPATRRRLASVEATKPIHTQSSPTKARRRVGGMFTAKSRAANRADARYPTCRDGVTSKRMPTTASTPPIANASLGTSPYCLHRISFKSASAVQAAPRRQDSTRVGVRVCIPRIFRY